MPIIPSTSITLREPPSMRTPKRRSITPPHARSAKTVNVIEFSFNAIENPKAPTESTRHLKTTLRDDGAKISKSGYAPP